jgi:hypothetical protein
MNQEFPTIAVTPVSNGVYRVFSLYEKESVALTAQGLLELAAWIAANRETLEAEVKQEAVKRPEGASMLMSGR